MKVNIILPDKVKYIINKLNKCGYEAYAVGGCVRDSILGRGINDWDITTNAKPENVVKIFKRTIKTGIKHGTITVIIDKESFEITTFRVDGEYYDNRHPNDVIFVSDIKEDLARRDFTINAMAYNEESGLIDCFSGLDDLQRKVIKSVGDPKERFKEDALRIMRGIRFASQLGFEIDSDTVMAMKKLSSTIKNISIERIVIEFNKILLADSSYVNNLESYGLLQVFLPEVSECKGKLINRNNEEFDMFDYLIYCLNSIENKIHLKLTILFMNLKITEITKERDNIDSLSDKAIKILKRLKYDNKTISKVSSLVKYNNVEIKDKKSLKEMLNVIGIDLFYDLLKIKEAETLLGDNECIILKKKKLEKVNKLLDEVIRNKECYSIGDLKINGTDLKSIGINNGKTIGTILNKLLDEVLNKPELNEKDKLIAIAKKYC